METVAPRLQRSEFYAHTPNALQALQALVKAVESSGLDMALTEIVNARVSQMNGCAFCIAYHVAEARRLGVADRKLHLLAAWREAPDFSAEERAALQWAEAVTRIGANGVPDGIYAEALQVLGEAQLARLTVAVALVNAWTRIAAPYRFTPPRIGRAQDQ